jgi:VanZ like family
MMAVSRSACLVRRPPLTFNRLSAYLAQYGFAGFAMARLLFDRKAMRLCARLWGGAWIGVALALLLPLGVPAPGRTDLLWHFLLFGVMAFATVGFSRRPGQLACLALATIACATALEYAQGLVPYRTFDPIDAVANSAGALAGYVAALLVLYYVIRPAAPRYGPVVP